MSEQAKQMDLQQLLALIGQSKEKQDALSSLAGQQVTGQPMLNQGQSMGQFLMGRGNTQAQGRGLNQFYTSILNRDKTKQTIGGAAGEGFERGAALMDEIRGRQHQEKVAGAAQEAQAAQQVLSNAGSVYGMQQKDVGQVLTYEAAMEKARMAAENARLGRESAESIASGNRASREGIEGAKLEAKKQEKMDAKAEKEEAQRVTAEANVAGISEIMMDLKDINQNITGWTSGVTAGIGRASPTATDAKRQQGRYDSLKSKLAIGRLQEMRAAADNGASGFGQLTKNEFDSLMNSIDTLDITTSEAQQRESIDNIRKYYVKALADYSSVLSSVPKGTGGDVDLSGYSPAAQAAIAEALQ